MKLSVGILLVVLSALAINDADCWWGRRRRRSPSGGGTWGLNTGGVTYTFKNGVRVTGYGKIQPKEVGVRVTIPFGRKRRAAETEQDQLPSTTIEQGSEEKCNECLEIQPYNVNDMALDNETLARNAFVMVVKFVEENKSATKMAAQIRFTVDTVVKTPNDDLQAGQSFTIKAKMAQCPCLASLEPGYYIVTGTVDQQGRLVLSNVLMEFEQ